jgi:ureidoglycolate hydrolase
MTLLQPQTLTSAAWAPFGWLPVRDTDAADGEHTLEYAWSDPHLNVISHGPEEIEHNSDGAVVTRLYRHDTHTQALMALNCRGIVAVAPAAVEFRNASDLNAIRAFAVEPLAPFVLHRGTWHWGPFPIGADPILLLNVQGRRYIEDNASADIAAVGTVIVTSPT